MRYDADHKARTRERVLTVAKQAIRKDGVSNLGVATVMKEAGLTHGGFYAHFPSRDALIDAAVEAMLRARRRGSCGSPKDWRRPRRSASMSTDTCRRRTGTRRHGRVRCRRSRRT